MIESSIVGIDNITVATVKKHLNIEFEEDNSYLENLIAVSLNAVENYTRSVFLERENVQNIGIFGGLTPTTLPTLTTDYPPKRITTIEYTLAGVVENKEIPQRNAYNLEKEHFFYSRSHIVIFLLEGIETDANTDVLLKWNTGFSGKIDDNITQARLLLIGTYYDNRESVTALNVKEVPQAVEFLLDAYIQMQIG